MSNVIQQFDLSGKTAIVTGAGFGLGRVFAETLAEAGASVIVTDRDGPGADETASLIEAAGGKATAMTVDVADPAAIEAMAAEIAKDHGGAQILVNNAGITCRSTRLHEMPVEDWNEVLAINLSGVFLCTRAMIPQMLDAGSGSIINISSILGLVGHQGRGHRPDPPDRRRICRRQYPGQRHRARLARRHKARRCQSKFHE
jgi:NAD(P)-dependent dehydrogenase (short-subunit alcohol dehydrogenase family)